MTSTAMAFTVDPEEVLGYDTSRELLTEDASGPSVDLSPSPFVGGYAILDASRSGARSSAIDRAPLKAGATALGAFDRE
jgi:hypothetical protein